MYSYIVVDDEFIIRKGMIVKLSQIKEVELECIGEAANGMQGLELVKNKNPDIIITDMKMNEMNGVEFLNELAKTYPSKPVIVISGYQEFEYVRNALEKRAIGYVLKPFSVEELAEQINKAILKIKENQLQQEMKTQMKRIHDRNVRENILDLIIQDYDEKSDALLEAKGIELCKDYAFIVLYAKEENLEDRIEMHTQELFNNTQTYVIKNSQYSNQYFVVIKYNNNKVEKYRMLLKKLCNLYRTDISDKKVYIFYGKEAIKKEQFNKYYKLVEQQIKMMNLGTLSGIWKIEDEQVQKGSRYIFSEEDMQFIFTKLKYDVIHARGIMNKFFEDLFEQTDRLDIIGNECQRLISRINEYATANHIETEDIMQKFYHRYLFCDGIKKIENEISGYITLVLNSMEISETGGENEIDSIIAYINANYYKKMTLQELANKFYMSSTTCSNLIKKELGKSFNDYISELRVKRAKELLLETELSVEHISEEVGYTNPKYFFRVFKKHVLDTPKDFRNKNKGR